MILGLLLTGAAAAQPTVEEFSYDVTVGYNLAYRDQHWTPVFVSVRNDYRDIEGHVEVRLFIGDTEQSPTYVIPAQLPKGSRKRFQFSVYMDGTTRVEARVFHGSRPVTPVAMYLDTTPVRERDHMALVLDENATDFGFINIALSTGAGNVRFYRDEITSRELGTLADNVRCYDAYEMIVLGDIDVGRITPRQWAMFEEYVHNGGVLAVNTGEWADRYRGTPAEALAGIRIGPAESYAGPAWARAVFGEGAAVTQARAVRSGLAAELRPEAEGIAHVGAERVLMTRRPLGRGLVVACATDAASKMLHDVDAYHDLWLELLDHRAQRAPLSYASAAREYAAMLPHESGIELYSRDSVIAYLWAYFLVAIVANGLVCYGTNRRAWAWPILVLCSIGFTLFAVVFGTAGRADNSRWTQVNVLHTAENSDYASVRALGSLLSARTSRQDLALTQPDVMVYGNETLQQDMMLQRNFAVGLGNNEAFAVSQGPQPAILDFHVGASEIRFVTMQGQTLLPGMVNAALHIHGGQLRGVVEADGLELTDPQVFYRGRGYLLNRTDDSYVVAGRADGRALNRVYGQQGQAFKQYRAVLLSRLTEVNAPMYGGYDPNLDAMLEETRRPFDAPVLIATVPAEVGGPLDWVEPELELQQKELRAILVVDLEPPETDAGAGRFAQPVRLRPGVGNFGGRGAAYTFAPEQSEDFHRVPERMGRHGMVLEIVTPLDVSAETLGAVTGVIRLTYELSPPYVRQRMERDLPPEAQRQALIDALSVELRAMDSAAEETEIALDPELTHSYLDANGGTPRSRPEVVVEYRFTVDDAAALYDERKGVVPLQFTAYLKTSSESGRHALGDLLVNVTAEVEVGESDNKGRALWQLSKRKD